ncbi:histidine kinase [Leptospira perolatii]|uniref:histidine kinase n=1 Tax=Leptospira perolatii TaxID=2023191 RepID=A0A2M9ZN69_9LEPT|nr:PAS domain S-box protein [Leptospira perolatii]PJZ68917.1 histidine kinase [Leptospira perolatii]PJZ73464.1 histidine kinase [Leptospira perolatii]
MFHPWLYPAILASLPWAFFLLCVYLYLYYQERQKALLVWGACWFFHLLYYIGYLLQVSGYSEIFFPVLTLDLLRAYLQLLGCIYFLKRSLPGIWNVFFFGIGAYSIYQDFSGLKEPMPVTVLLFASYLYTGTIFLRSTDANIGKRLAGVLFLFWSLHAGSFPFLDQTSKEFVSFGFVLGSFFRFSIAISFLLLVLEDSKEAFLRSEAKYRKIVDTSQEGIWVIDHNSITTFMNHKMCQLLGRPVDELIGKSLFELTDPIHKNIIEERLEQRKAGKSEIHEFQFAQPDGSVKWTLMSASPLHDEQGNYEGALAMVTDITPIKMATEALRERERQISTLIQNLPGIAFRCKEDTNWTMEFISDGCKELTGYSASEFVKNTVVAFADIIHPEDRQAVYDSVNDSRWSDRPYQLIYRIVRRDGEIRWLLEQGSAVKNEKGETLALEGFISDFTQVKLAEDIVAEALKEKELLLKEVHHRVKNYLQVLSSLISLHLDQIKASDPVSVLKESQNRILSMAFVHESLYGKQSLSEDFLPEYVKKLTENLLHSFGWNERELTVDIQCDSIQIRQDAFIPIGLILNELVTNCLKHGFPAFLVRDQKILRINVSKKEDSIYLEVEDNGVGKKVTNSNRDSLGLQLIELLTRQLKGTVTDLKRSEGTATQVRFPI